MIFHRFFQVAVFVSVSLISSVCFGDTIIENGQSCAMKNLDVQCEKGDTIKLDVIRTHDQRGDIFLNINSAETIGDYILLYINGGKPEILKMENISANVNSASKGAFIPRSIISKLRNATSVHFKISMEKRNPISGSLGQYQFDWLKRFGMACT
jgi:hypothetical protein